MLSNTFNYITGVASIISFVIALTPYFPKYKEYIRYLTVFFFGTLLGSLFASASSQAVLVQFEGSVVQAMLIAAAGISLVILIVIILSVALGGKVKESHAVAGSSAAALFIFMMIFYGISFLPGPSVSARKNLDESLGLARYHRQTKNLTSAMNYYCEAMRSAQFTTEQKKVELEVQQFCSN